MTEYIPEALNRRTRLLPYFHRNRMTPQQPSVSKVRPRDDPFRPFVVEVACRRRMPGEYVEKYLPDAKDAVFFVSCRIERKPQHKEPESHDFDETIADIVVSNNQATTSMKQ